MSKSPDILARYEKKSTRVHVPVKPFRNLTPTINKSKRMASLMSITSNSNKSFITNSQIHTGYYIYTSGFRDHKSISSQMETIFNINSFLLSYYDILNNNEQNINLLPSINNSENFSNKYSKISLDVSHYLYNINKNGYTNKEREQEYSDSCIENKKYLEQMLVYDDKYMNIYKKKFYVPKISCQIKVKTMSRLHQEKMAIQKLRNTPKNKVITEEDMYYLPYMKNKNNKKSKTLMTSYSSKFTTYQTDRKKEKSSRTEFENKVINNPQSKPNQIIKNDFFTGVGKTAKHPKKSLTPSNRTYTQRSRTPKSTQYKTQNTTRQVYKNNNNNLGTYYVNEGSFNSQQIHRVNRKRIEKLKELKQRLEKMKNESSEEEDYNEEDNDFDDRIYFRTDAK